MLFIYGLAQDCGYSIADSLESPQSCTKPPICLSGLAFKFCRYHLKPACWFLPRCDYMYKCSVHGTRKNDAAHYASPDCWNSNSLVPEKNVKYNLHGLYPKDLHRNALRHLLIWWSYQVIPTVSQHWFRWSGNKPLLEPMFKLLKNHSVTSGQLSIYNDLFRSVLSLLIPWQFASLGHQYLW